MKSYASVQLSYMKCKLVPSTKLIINVTLTPKEQCDSLSGNRDAGMIEWH